jgi:hypothetical protein
MNTPPLTEARMEHKLEIACHKCTRCGSIFEALHLAEQVPYGEFLLRSENGEHLALLEALDDRLFNELAPRIDQVAKLNRRARAPIVQRLYGLLADKAPDGSSYGINREPPCPQCSSQSSTWTMVERFVTADLAVPTHKHWDGLSDSERQDAVRLHMGKK